MHVSKVYSRLLCVKAKQKSVEAEVNLAGFFHGKMQLREKQNPEHCT